MNGKPRIVSQQYLGSAEEIAQRLFESGPGEPDRSRHLAFGDLAGVWGVLDRLGVAEIIDEVVGSRRSDAAASVGTYIALATLNRVVAPCSKLAFAEWWETTAGERVVSHLSPGALDHRRFWDAMDTISPTQLDPDRAQDHRAHGRDLRGRRLGARPRHDELRHLHRLGQRPRPHCPARPRQAEEKRPDGLHGGGS